jgi:hypothetical protein
MAREGDSRFAASRREAARSVKSSIMTTLPAGSLLVRTWFGDDNEWQRLASAVAQPSEDGFLANVSLVDDRATRASPRTF